MRRIITIATICLLSLNCFAQGIDDARQLSQTYYQGTAKALGMGNALGSVGGDMTAISINPAGLGLYRNYETSATISLLDNFSTSSYYGSNTMSNKLRLTVPEINYVSVKPRSNFRPLRYTQFCIGLTRSNDYNMHTYASGLNPSSSMIDNYLTQINGYSVDELADNFGYTVYPAWSTYLIDVYEDDLGQYYGSPVPQGGIMQSYEQFFKGRNEEWTFGYSANYYDRLFVGISLGIPHIKRSGSRVFKESMPANSNITTDFNEWTFTEDISTNGIGVNGKVGLIWIANRWLRVGASFHSPTIYKLDESWQTETESEITWITRKYISTQSNYEYDFISPMKWLGSLAFVVGEKGLVSFDAEFVNYGNAKFIANDYDYTTVNQDIKANYAQTFNFRLGTEWLLGNTYFRAGTGFYGSPFGLGESTGSVEKASIGLSIPVLEDTTFDFAYELTHAKDSFTLYDAGELGIEPITQRQFKSRIAVTLRVKY